MNFGELKEHLKTLNITYLGYLSKTPLDTDERVTTINAIFTADTKLDFVYAPKTTAFLPLTSTTDDQYVHSEKIKALKRKLIPGWDEE